MATTTFTDIESVKRIVLERLAPHAARVYLFGSRATGGTHRGSDIDVGVLPLETLPTGLLAELRDVLENSPILSSVDLVDLSRVEPAFRQRVEEEGILWTK